MASTAPISSIVMLVSFVGWSITFLITINLVWEHFFIHSATVVSKMSFASFTIGLLFSTAASIWSFEKLRDRRLLCDKKFDENEVMNYLYKMVRCSSLFTNVHLRSTQCYSECLFLCCQKLRNKMDTAREGGERGILDETRLLVNEHVVKNIHSASNTLFTSNPIQYVQNLINEKTK